MNSNMLKTLHRSLEHREKDLENVLKQIHKIKHILLSNELEKVVEKRSEIQKYIELTEKSLIDNRETLALCKGTNYGRMYEQVYDDLDTFTFNNRKLLSRLDKAIPQDDPIYTDQAILDIYKVEIKVTDNQVTIRTPHLLTHRRKKSALCEPIVKAIYQKARQEEFPKFDKAVIISNIINPENGKYYVDCDNIEYIKIINALTLFITPNDDSVSCFHFAMGETSKPSDYLNEGTEITVISQKDFPSWIDNRLKNVK